MFYFHIFPINRKYITEEYFFNLCVNKIWNVRSNTHPIHISSIYIHECSISWKKGMSDLFLFFLLLLKIYLLFWALSIMLFFMLCKKQIIHNISGCVYTSKIATWCYFHISFYLYTVSTHLNNRKKDIDLRFY